MSRYLKNIKDAFGTMTEGLKLTFRYLTEARHSRKPIGIENETYFEQDKGIVTLQYPYESLPVPDNGRYRLHNEIDDCIVCDKCAKVCPVDCIEIDPIRAPQTYGVTSDGTPKRIHAAKFDIDMSKCCFCGLCTTVCPTECLTMTKVYDFSEFEVEDHVYSFANMSLADIAQKRKELEDFEAQKAKAKEEVADKKPVKATTAKPAVKPKAAKPQMKPKAGSKPVVRPVTSKPEDTDAEKKKSTSANAKAKPKMKPKIQVASKPVINPKQPGDESGTSGRVKPVIKPKVKPVVKSTKSKDAPEPEVKKNKPPKPVIKPKAQADSDENKDKTDKPKFRPRPVIKRKPKDDK